MALTPGTRLGVYEITALIGEGGMGQVYRARDTKLNRDVALKVLPDSFASDPERLARFTREAQTLASLNHPNIAAIYGIEESKGVRALVMELVEGDDLSQRIARGAIPLDEALPIARQIAEALEAAHEQGVIHRDLKPANIKVRGDGTVKVLDFGLAKAMEPTGAMSLGLSQAPTITTPAMTQAGMVLGTAAYMSPEQARGKPVDKRADIWAFGAVLFEMLTGRRAFGGEDVAETLANVINREAAWEALPTAAPTHVRQTLRLCLRKPLRERVPDIGAVRLALEGAFETAAPQTTASATSSAKAGRLVWMAALAVAGVLVVAMAVPTMRHLREAPAILTEMRLEVTAPTQVDNWQAISPDGRMLVFGGLAQGKWQLWIRPLDAVTARPLARTEGGVYPFWSPDSRSLGFFADGNLKRIDIAGGPPQTLARTPEPRGGAWGADGVIIFTPEQNGPLYRISAAGGGASAATRVDAGQLSHRFPSFLPDGRHFLYYASGDRSTYLGAVDGSASKRLLASDSMAIYTPPGFLLFLRQRSLLAQRFDLETSQVSGDPFPVADSVSPAGNVGSASLSAAANGTVAFRPLSAGGARRLAWFDRSGKEIGEVGNLDSKQNISSPELSPDGAHVGFFATVSENSDIWLIDTARSIPTRFTVAASGEQWPLWSPDGSRIVFSSSRKGNYDLYQAPTGGNGVEEPLLESPGTTIATSWSSDGRFVLYSQLNPQTGFDLWALPLFGDRKPLPVVATASDEEGGQFSKDMRWIAYESNESGRFEIVVQPFMNAGGKLQISTGGGIAPRWRADGKELFYVAPDRTLMGVPIAVSKDGKSLEPGNPVPLVPARTFPTGYTGPTKPPYDVTPDGQRFLMLVPGEEANPPITVLLNWRSPAR